jgi:GT2 family glycosyltransferase
MLISIIILNYNGQKDTLNCLKSLEKLTIPKGVQLDTIIIDNASSDNSVPAIKKQFPQIFLIESAENLGFAAGNNLGLKLALDQNSDFALLLNNDTLVDKNLIKELISAAHSHPQGAIFSPKIYFAPGREFHKDRYTKKDRGKVIWAAGGQIDWQNVYGQNRGIDQVDHGQFDQETQLNLGPGCCILIRAQAIKQVGTFDPRYFLYYEDTDLCVRTKRTPLPSSFRAKPNLTRRSEESPPKPSTNPKNITWQIWYAPKAIVWHVNAASSSPGSHLHDYYITRNRLLFGLTHAPLRAKYNLVAESLKLLLTGRPWQKRGVRDFYLRKFGPGSWK